MIEGTWRYINDALGERVLSEKNRLVCECVKSNEVGYLIAAAPDLYRALAWVVKELANSRVIYGTSFAKIDAALAKARGEAR